MPAKIRLEEKNSVYEINATLIADHKAKKQSKGHMDPMVMAYSIVYGEIFDEALQSPQILENWIRSSMSWESIKENAKLISGSQLEQLDCAKASITYLQNQTKQKEA